MLFEIGCKYYFNKALIADYYWSPSTTTVDTFYSHISFVTQHTFLKIDLLEIASFESAIHLHCRVIRLHFLLFQSTFKITIVLLNFAASSMLRCRKIPPLIQWCYRLFAHKHQKSCDVKTPYFLTWALSDRLAGQVRTQAISTK
jgi:hypothetical protein